MEPLPNFNLHIVVMGYAALGPVMVSSFERIARFQKPQISSSVAATSHSFER
jgi:hypothetical protein